MDNIISESSKKSRHGSSPRTPERSDRGSEKSERGRSKTSRRQYDAEHSGKESPAMSLSPSPSPNKRRSAEVKYLDLSDVIRLREEFGELVIGNANIQSPLQVETRECEICGEIATQRYKMGTRSFPDPAWLCESCVSRICQGSVTITGAPVKSGCCFR